MFRKPKNRGNQRQRVRQDSDEAQKEKAPTPPPVEPEKSPSPTFERSPSPDPKVNNGGASKPATLLSFDDDEGADVTEFRVKKQDARKRREKLARKAQSLKDLEVKKKEEEISEEKMDTQTQKTDYDNVRFTNSESLPVFKQPEKELDEEEILMYEEEEFGQDKKTRGKFPSTFQDIPDAHAVYEARKKREQMRKGLLQDQNRENDDGFIPLNGQKESDMVRNTESGSDEEDDDHGRFYSSKNELMDEEKKRRELQFDFLSREQGDNDDGNGGSNSEDEEVLRWEREQISKGVRKQKMAEARQEWLAAAGKDLQDAQEQDVMEIDNIVRMPARILEPAEFIPVPIEQVISDLGLKAKEEQEILNATEDDYTKIMANMEENRQVISSLPMEQQKAEEKYRMLQEMKEFSGNLIECFDEKVPVINGLEDQLFQMWKTRNERLLQRRRQDLKDEYEACTSAATGNTASIRTGEHATRAAERDARRSRRRLQRERSQQDAAPHNEGFSSDDEETNSQLTLYKDTTDSVVRQSEEVFADVLAEFLDICRICDNFVKWLAVDEESYSNAYIGMCIPKLLNPLVRHELMGWNPLVDGEKSLSSMNWYKRLLAVGTDGLGVDLNHEEIVKLIPSVVQKCILPRLTRLVKECYDPLSLRQSQNLAKLISECIADYPTVSASAKEVKMLLKSIHEAFKLSIDEDVFIPIFTFKGALENTYTGCSAFLNRQFWIAIKAIHCIKSFSGIFSDEAMQALIMDGVVNRYVILAMQCLWPHSTEADNAVKCRAIIKALPKEWFPAENAILFRSLRTLFNHMAQHYNEKTANRSLASELKKFANDIGHDC